MSLKGQGVSLECEAEGAMENLKDEEARNLAHLKKAVRSEQRSYNHGRYDHQQRHRGSATQTQTALDAVLSSCSGSWICLSHVRLYLPICTFLEWKFYFVLKCLIFFSFVQGLANLECALHFRDFGL